MNEIGQCGKCSSEIKTEAERCPECGYEPSKLGVIHGLLGFFAINIFAVSFGIAIISLILLFDGAELSTAIFGFGFFGVIAAAAGAFLYATYRKTQLTPTNDEIEYNIGG